jgi:hypothetical protein
MKFYKYLVVGTQDAIGVLCANRRFLLESGMEHLHTFSVLETCIG